MRIRLDTNVPGDGHEEFAHIDLLLLEELHELNRQALHKLPIIFKLLVDAGCQHFINSVHNALLTLLFIHGVVLLDIFLLF